MDFTILKDIVVSIGAIGGLGLGIYNYRREKQKDKIHLKVKPISIHFMDDGNAFGYSEIKVQDDRKFETIGVKVINLSKFDITISEVGFKLKNNDHGEKLAFPHVVILDGSKSLPVRLPSRESIIMVFKSEQLPDSPLREDIESIYVATGCDLYFYGQSDVLSDFINMEIKSK